MGIKQLLLEAFYDSTNELVREKEESLQQYNEKEGDKAHDEANLAKDASGLLFEFGLPEVIRIKLLYFDFFYLVYELYKKYFLIFIHPWYLCSINFLLSFC